MRRGFFLGNPFLYPFGVPPEELFLSHIDNPTEIKLLAALLTGTRTPRVALATPNRGNLIANTKDAPR